MTAIVYKTRQLGCTIDLTATKTGKELKVIVRVCCYLIWNNTPLNAALLVQKHKPQNCGSANWGLAKCPHFHDPWVFQKPGFNP